MPGSRAPAKHPLLVALGERVRELRSRRGMTRRSLAQAAGVSERHLANLEHGVGNASVLVLDGVASALGAPLAALIGDVTTASPDWLMIRALLEGRSAEELRRAHAALSSVLGAAEGGRSVPRRVALVGLRGAGKSTLGARLAADLRRPFIEMTREIERLAGCAVSEIHALYGPSAYRRYERRALEAALDAGPETVIATPGGIVSDAASFNALIANCCTVWLKAEPEDHMRRVAEQGDLRPMAASREAMADLKRILAGRSAFYARADLVVDTSAAGLEEVFTTLRARVRGALGLAT